MSDICERSDCANCQRVDLEVLDRNSTKLVTYIGEYVVITVGAPEFDDMRIRMLWKLGAASLPAYITLVGYLGSDKVSIAESIELVEEDDFYRFWIRHDSATAILDEHKGVVAAMNAGLVDLHRGRGEEFFNERDLNAERMQQEAIASLEGRMDDLD